jgi:N-acetylglucosaminyltransferase
MALLGVGGFGWVAIGGVLSPSTGNALARYLPVSLYGAIILSYLGIQVLFAWLEHRRQHRVKRASSYPAMTVVLPTYNQPPEDLHTCIESVVRQDYPGILQLVVVDDGSRKPPCAAALGLYRFDGQERRAELIYMPQNGGKRRAQKAAFDQAIGSYIVTIDDDTSLAPDAISRLVDLMESDPRIGAASASIRVRNRHDLFTTLIDLRYWASNHLERASQSYLGVVNCCSGPLAIYRTGVVARVKDEYISCDFPKY